MTRRVKASDEQPARKLYALYCPALERYFGKPAGRAQLAKQLEAYEEKVGHALEIRDVT